MNDSRFFSRNCQELRIKINDSILGRTKNLSLSGALCLVNKYIEEGTSVSINLELPKVNITIEGICKRCEKLESRQYSVAVKFDAIPATSKSRIQLEDCLQC